MIKALLAILLSIISIPIIGLLLLFDYVPNIPVDAYTYVPTSELLAEQVQANISTLQSGELEIQLEEQFINQLLFSTFVEQVNPSYNPGSDCADDACNYLLTNDTEGAAVALTGIWVRLLDDVVSVNVGLRSLSIPFQTKVRLDFAITDNPDVFEIEYSRLQLGNIPLPGFVIRPVINFLIEQANVASTVSEGGLLLDLEQLVLQIDKQAVIDTTLDPQAGVLASILVEEQLIRLAVDRETSRVVLYVDVDKLYANRELQTYSDDQEGVFTELLIDVFGSLDFNLFEGFSLTQNEYYISQTGLNQIITAQFGDADTGSLFDSPLASMLFSLEPLWMELDGSNATLVLPLVFLDNLIPVELHMRSVASNDDLLLEVERITIGRDAQKTSAEYIIIEGNQIDLLLAQLSFGAFSVDPGSRVLRIPVQLFDDAMRELAPSLRIHRLAIENGQFQLTMDLA